MKRRLRRECWWTGPSYFRQHKSTLREIWLSNTGTGQRPLPIAVACSFFKSPNFLWVITRSSKVGGQEFPDQMASYTGIRRTTGAVGLVGLAEHKTASH